MSSIYIIPSTLSSELSFAQRAPTDCEISKRQKFLKTARWYMLYGAAMISRLLKILGLFCRISCLLQGSFAIKTYNLKVPTHRSHPIGAILFAAEYVYYTHNTESTTGWRRLIGSPKLQFIFHKRATKYRSRLRKMTYKDKGSYESSPPCS